MHEHARRHCAVSWTRVTGVIFDTRVHEPWTRSVDTAREHGLCVPSFISVIIVACRV